MGRVEGRGGVGTLRLIFSRGNPFSPHITYIRQMRPIDDFSLITNGRYYRLLKFKSKYKRPDIVFLGRKVTIIAGYRFGVDRACQYGSWNIQPLPLPVLPSQSLSRLLTSAWPAMPAYPTCRNSWGIVRKYCRMIDHGRRVESQLKMVTAAAAKMVELPSIMMTVGSKLRMCNVQLINARSA